MTTPAPHSHSPAITIGARYRVLEELGRGGSAVVYRVHDVGTGRELALKQQLASAAQQAPSLLEREYYGLAQLAHPRVIAVYDYGLDAAGPFYTMELLDGGDLKQLSPMPAERACRLMLDVCSSLALLHSRRLVHRDVTPRNVRCTRDGHAKLIDFGAMALMGPSPNIAGTPAFIAPEVVQKVSIDGRADLFSLGATLYYTLTGRPPFLVRHFNELRDAYTRDLIVPSRLVAGIPPALDALCVSLLRLDPGQRPRGAFEVMHKLAAIAGAPHDEPLGVSQAYLTTPLLCGREAQLRAFRQRIRHAVHGSGSALLFRSAPGLGRSRLLDACALEAKTLGVTVLRAGAGSGAPFALAGQLCEQLVQALPEVALQTAERARAREILFEAPGPNGEAQLRRLDAGTLDRTQLQAALGAWLSRVCETHALLLLVDDVQRIDSASLAWLAALVLAAPELRLQLTATADTTRASTAFNVLAKHCAVFELQPLTQIETETLLRSVFGSVPHLPMLTERLYAIARGNPGETLLLAQHLVDAGAVHYRDGQWTLPSELRPGDLPASAGEAMRARIAALPALARKLAHFHALCRRRPLRFEEYTRLAPEASAADIDAALHALRGAELLSGDGERFQLSHPALADVLCELQDEHEQQRQQLALYELELRAHATQPYVLVPHLVGAARYAEAFDLMLAGEPFTESTIENLDAQRLAESLERLLEKSAELGRSQHEAHELRRRLCALAVIADDSLHARFAPAWLAQLCHDSGLDDYRALDASEPAQTRIMRALAAAGARHTATPEAERVYSLEQAIKHLSVYVLTSIVIGIRTADAGLIQSLPELIEPFAPLSPALHAMWQNVLGLVESHVFGRRLSTALRHRKVYERLCELKTTELPYLQSVRGALAHSVGSFEAYLGRPAAFDWATLLDADPMQRVAAMEIRRTSCLMRGETERAESYERQAELLTLRSQVRRMFDRPLPQELEAALLNGDLARVKRVIDDASQNAAKHPAWQPLVLAAEGYFELLRGEPVAALSAFERSLASGAAPEPEPPRQIAVWLLASAGSMQASSALGRDAECVQVGERALARCEAIGVEIGWHRIARVLAAAEARCGRVTRAIERIEAVMAIEEREGIFGLHRAATYETRAQLAVCAGDDAAAREYTRRAADARGGATSSASWARVEPAAAPELQYLSRQSAPSERAARVLERLCELARSNVGHLFLVGPNEQLQLAASRNAPAPDAATLHFVRGFFAQQLDDAMLSEVLSRATNMLSVPGVATYYADDGTAHYLTLLTCKVQGELAFVGVALIAAEAQAEISHDISVHASALSSELLSIGDCLGLYAQGDQPKNSG